VTGSTPVRASAVLPDLGSPVARDQIGGDPVQPGPRIGPVLLVVSTLPERGKERLGDDVVGRLRSEPAQDVTLDIRRVPAEHHGELLWVVQGVGDDSAVVFGVVTEPIDRRSCLAVRCHR
jgi:hypothetical protein